MFGTIGNAETILDSAEQRIYNIRQGKTTDGPTKLGDIVINDVIPNVTLLSTPEGKDRKGIPTGFSVLDKYMTGLNKSTLFLSELVLRWVKQASR